MSNVRKRKNVSLPTKATKSEEEDVQPDAGWGVFFKVCVFVFLVVPTLLIGVLILFVESPVDPVPYTLPDPPKLDGPLTPNDLIVYQGKRLYEGVVRGPESLIYRNGHIYTGTSDGKILHIEHSTGTVEVIAELGTGPCGRFEYEHHCGRPLGMRFDNDGYLIVLDAYLGMYKINVATRDVYQMFPSSMEISGQRLRFLNDLDIASDGTIYFTDSADVDRRDFTLSLMEGAGKGRLLKHDPAANKTEVLLEKLYFANGVQLSKDESFLLVAETTQTRILKYHLQGPKKGEAEIFADNLPGTVDNIRRSSSGGYWAVLGICRHADRFNLIDFLGPYPGLRKQLAKVPTKYHGLLLPRCGLIVELSQEGQIVRSLQDLNGERLQFMSEVEDHAGTLYIGSFASPYIGIVDTFKKPPSS